MQQYSFRILEWKEITSYLLADAGIMLEKQHFVKPTMEVLWPVYENLLLISMGITREELHQPAYHAVQKLRYPELHEPESVGTLASVRAIKKLMAITGVHDFSMMDLSKPDSKRTITNQSAIINFLRFNILLFKNLYHIKYTIIIQEGIMQRLRTSVRAETAITRSFKQTVERLAALYTKIEAIEAIRRVKQPAVQDLEAETKEVNRDIQVLNKQFGALGSDMRALEQEGFAVAGEVSAEELFILQLKDEQERLKSQIVQSPYYYRDLWQRKKATSISAKASAEEARLLLTSWKDKLESNNDAEKKLKKGLGMPDAVDKLFAFKSLNTQDKFGCSLIDEGWTVIESPQILSPFDLQISCNFEENLSDFEELQVFSSPKNEFVNFLKLSSPANEFLEDLGDESFVEVKSMPPLGVSHAVCANLPVIGINDDTFTDILSQNEGEKNIDTQDKPGWSFIDDGWTVIESPGSLDDVREAHGLVFGP